MSSTSLSQVSEKILYAVKVRKDTQEFQTLLKNEKFSTLLEELHTDDLKLSFWINIYNAYFQILRNTELVPKNKIYTSKVIAIAQEMFSLDDIEHGILRRYRFKYSLGLFAKPFTPKVIKQLAVDKIDYRIHFALNCGAESCPPIAFYNYHKIDKQLDVATISFLESESHFDHEQKILKTTQLLKWFRYDFGGRKGIDQMYLHHLNKDIKGFQIKYSTYSWKEQLDNFVEE